jgi:DNA polymerase III sliding clamp (beta) subunit (PCNA family)
MEDKKMDIKRTFANEEDFEKILFVCKARPSEIKHSLASVLHVEGTKTGCRLVATDGRRLHVAELKIKIKSGDYKPSVTKDVVKLGEPVSGVIFPKWQRAIPESADKQISVNLVDACMGKNLRSSERLSVEFTALTKKTGAMINLRHLEDLQKTQWCVFSQADKNKPLLFRAKDNPLATFAVIMPLPKAA